MNYNKILRTLAERENVSVKEIENEMRAAIHSAGLHCSIKEFIKAAVLQIKKDYI